jgi:hypothetical protein
MYDHKGTTPNSPPSFSDLRRRQLILATVLSRGGSVVDIERRAEAPEIYQRSPAKIVPPPAERSLSRALPDFEWTDALEQMLAEEADSQCDKSQSPQMRQRASGIIPHRLAALPATARGLEFGSQLSRPEDLNFEMGSGRLSGRCGFVARAALREEVSNLVALRTERATVHCNPPSYSMIAAASTTPVAFGSPFSAGVSPQQRLPLVGSSPPREAWKAYIS